MRTPALEKWHAMMPLVALAATFGASMYVVATQVLMAAGFPLDDSWIHQVIGRNLALHGVPSFVPGEAPAGSTSTLWPFVVALNYVMFPAIKPYVFLLALNILLTGLSLASIALMATRDRLPPVETASLAILPSLTGNVLWLTTTGMEHSLFVACVLVAALVWTSSLGRVGLRAGLTGLCLGMAILTRIEALFFVPIFLVEGWWGGRLTLANRRYTQATLLLLPIAGAALLVLANNLWTSGTIMPVTLRGRRWLYFGVTSPPLHLLATELLVEWATFIEHWFLGFDFSGLVDKFARWAISFILCFSFLGGLFHLLRLRARHVLFIVALAATDLAAYALFLPAMGHGGRYQPLIAPLVLPLVALGLVFAATLGFGKWLSKPGKFQLAAALPALVVAIAGAASVQQWAVITRAGIDHINNTHVRMGRWINQNLPPDAVVAAFDIGGIGYFSNRRIVDLGGLTDPGFVPHLYNRTVRQYLVDRRIHWLVLPLDRVGERPAQYAIGTRLGLQDSEGFTKLETISFKGDMTSWRIALAATWNAEFEQALYKLAWPK